MKDAIVRQGTATDLRDISDVSIDYIYTDPPYGSHIPYLDLSVMWNSWLNLPVTEKDYENEAIEGGERNKTKQDYSNLIAKSIQEMARTLKYDRWMSFVLPIRTQHIGTLSSIQLRRPVLNMLEPLSRTTDR